jgi:hypothetical protein
MAQDIWLVRSSCVHTHKGRQIKLLIADQNIRVITLDAELLAS